MKSKLMKLCDSRRADLIVHYLLRGLKIVMIGNLRKTRTRVIAKESDLSGHDHRMDQFVNNGKTSMTWAQQIQETEQVTTTVNATSTHGGGFTLSVESQAQFGLPRIFETKL